MSTAVFADTDIRIKVDNYENDTLLLGYYYWDNQFIKDTLVRTKKGEFRIEYEKELPQGIYLLIMRPENKFIQVVMGDDQEFRVTFDYNAPLESVSFKGSDENKIFNDYVKYLDSARVIATNIQERNDFHPRMMDSLNEAVKTRQEAILTEHPESMVALVIRTNKEPDIPEFQGTEEEVRERQYRFYLKHYFDHVDLKDPRLLYTSMLHPRIDRYIEKVVGPNPDSINKALDRILGEVKPSSETFKAILVHYLNKYAKSEYVGMDAVYVHLVENYYARDMAPWVGEESLAKMVDDASALKPLLIGKIAPDIKVYKRDGTPISLHEIEAPYTALIFWAPDCGHCKKSMPKLIEIYPQLQEDSVEVLAICTKLLDKEAGCWEFIDEKGTDLWINATDKYLRSKFKQKYNIKSTPQLYLLDRNKKILTKKIAVERIPEVLDILKEKGTD